MIRIRELNKKFRVHKKEAGLGGSLKSLIKRNYVEKQALRDISLDVEEGEILGLVGANGAGKTTLVKILAGIIHPDSGEVRILGHEPWKRKNEFRSQIALIMGQKAQLWWDLPALDCFMLLREIYRVPPRVHRERLDFLAETLGVSRLLDIQIRRLSLGERMKLELIAALLHNPRVVFLDEPTIGLDITAQRAIRNFLLEFRNRHKPAMLLTSHYMEDIERLCKRIVILREGEIVYDGSLEKILADYARYKIISAQLLDHEGETLPEPPRELGEILSLDRDFLKLQTPRDKAADAARFLLARYPVMDLNIEEEDISSVIENIMKGESG